MAVFAATTAYTPGLSKLALGALKTDFDANDNYHLIFSRAHSWQPGNDYELSPDYGYTFKTNLRLVQLREEYIRDFKQTAIASIKASHIDLTAPMITSAPRWDLWDYRYQSSLYLDKSTRRVYINIKAGRDAQGEIIEGEDIGYSRLPTGNSASTIEIAYPTATATANVFEQFWWRYLFTLTTDEYSRELDVYNVGGLSRWPVKNESAVQAAAVPGQIIGYKIIDPGSNLTSTPTITVYGDGSGAAATGLIYNGELKYVFPTSTTSLGSNYTRASILVSGGGSGREPIVEPIIALGDGIGADVAIDGRADVYGLHFDPGANNILSDDIEWRSLGVVRNLKNYAKTANYSSSVGAAYTELRVGAGDWQVGHRVARTTSPFVQGYIVSVDDVTYAPFVNIRVYQSPDPFNNFLFTQGDQSYSLNFGEVEWPSSGSLINLDTSATFSYTVDNLPDIAKGSGELLYIYSYTRTEIVNATDKVIVALRI